MIGITFCGLVGDDAEEIEGTLLAEVTCAACKKSPHDKVRFPDPIPFKLGKAPTHAGVMRSALDQQRDLTYVLEAARLYMAHSHHVTAIEKIVAKEARFVAAIINTEKERNQ